MTLKAGTRLRNFEILAQIGAGGMGEVYKARDLKLDRWVAIKVLPEALAGTPDLLARFEREAKAVAALNHPNILGLFDLLEADGIRFVVLELLEGETLRARLQAGPLPLRKVVELAQQMAQGLAAAHEKGIIHRDLKPENLFITREGRLKILDFGLAKQLPGPLALADTQAVSAGPGTEHGVVLGTMGYMSPEQVRGEAVDARADLFSFGAVLFEMATGRRAFARETAADTMAAILKEEPAEPGPATPPLPPGLRRILEHCLEKQPADRFQSARDLAFDLGAVTVSGVTDGPRPAGPARRRRGLAALAALALLAGAGAGLFWTGRALGLRDRPALTYRELAFETQAIMQAAFMPDGEAVVFSAVRADNVPELFVVRPEAPEPQPLGQPRTHLLSVSSRGELAVLTGARYVAHRMFIGTLARVALAGTAPRAILEDVRQADWAPDGSRLAIIRSVEGRDRLEFPIGQVLYESAGYLSDLRFSPRGDALALFEHPKRWDDRGELILVDLAGHRRSLAGTFAGTLEGLAWAGDEILFTAGANGNSPGNLYGIRPGGRRREILTTPGGLVLHDVSRSGRWLVTRDRISDRIAARAPGAAAERDLSWLDHSMHPFLSGDGETLLFNDQSESAGPNYGVCLRGTRGGPVTRLGEGYPGGLSPDGAWAMAIIFTPPQLMLYPTGPGESRRLRLAGLETYHTASWFPDGRQVLVCGNAPGQASRCYVLNLADGALRAVTPPGTLEGRSSPDGRQVAFLKPNQGWFTQDLQGGPPRAIPGLRPEEVLISWGPDGRSIYSYEPTRLPFRVERVELAGGRRTRVLETAPGRSSGFYRGYSLALSADLKAYAYDYDQITSQLYLVEGGR